jgi:pimeloyl-ACP methyl ester carboxylesterase
VVRSLNGWGKRLVNRAWHDPRRIAPEALESQGKAFRVHNWDRALWEVTLATEPLDTRRLREVRAPALVLSGDDDRVVPRAQSARLARELPQARFAVLPECGHVPQEERPAEFLAAVNAYLDTL